MKHVKLSEILRCKFNSNQKTNPSVNKLEKINKNCNFEDYPVQAELTQPAGAVEYTDCISTERQDFPKECSRY